MTQVSAPLKSRMLRMARAFPTEPGVRGPTRKELTSEQKGIARRMSWDGATYPEILAALGLDWEIQTFKKRLREINIKTRASRMAEHPDCRR